MASVARVVGTGVVFVVVSGVTAAIARRSIMSPDDLRALETPVRGFPLGPTDEQRANAKRIITKTVIAGAIGTVTGVVAASYAYKAK